MKSSIEFSSYVQWVELVKVKSFDTGPKPSINCIDKYTRLPCPYFPSHRSLTAGVSYNGRHGLHPGQR